MTQKVAMSASKRIVKVKSQEARTLPTAATRYVIDAKGRKRAVLLDIREYSRLIERLEQLEDAVDLDKAVRNATAFREYGLVREELRREGRL